MIFGNNICINRFGKIAGAFLLTITFAYHSAAQDAHLSQFFSSELTLNPALTGVFNGEHRGYLNYRSQWSSLMRKTPFETTILAYDRPYQRFGFGAYVMNNRAGGSGFNFFNFVLSGSYEITMDVRREHRLNVGLQLGFINKTFTPSTVDLQYDTAYGGNGGYNPGLPSGESFQHLNLFIPEVNFGVFYYHTKKFSKIRPYAGISAFHLTRPKETYTDSLNRIPIKLVGYGGARYKLDRYYSLEGNFLYMRQVNNNEFQVGVLVYYHIKGTDGNFFAGPYYRNQDAFIFHLGGTYEEYVIRLSYDFNTSSLNSISRGRGGFELSITYVKQRARYLPSIY